MTLWNALNETQSLGRDGYDDSWIEEYVLRTLTRMYEAYNRDAAEVPENRLYQVRYEDLVDDPLPVLREAYRRLELGDPAPAEEGLRSYLQEVKNYRTNRHTLDDQTRAMVRERWADYFERFGYE